MCSNYQKEISKSKKIIIHDLIFMYVMAFKAKAGQKEFLKNISLYGGLNYFYFSFLFHFYFVCDLFY
jgi:hypothetical protein